jgi:hypothetical protein
MKELSVSFLRECFLADFSTGVLTWKVRPSSHFNSDVTARKWNTKYSGKIAGSLKKGGYKRVGINDDDYLAHRVIYALYHGHWPEYGVDHIDGDTGNNRISNLRSVPHRDNLANQKLNSKNTSGTSGVYFNKRLNQWAAQMKRNQKTWHLGTFKTLEEAISARKRAEAEYGFHANHGRAR